MAWVTCVTSQCDNFCYNLMTCLWWWLRHTPIMCLLRHTDDMFATSQSDDVNIFGALHLRDLYVRVRLCVFDVTLRLHIDRSRLMTRWAARMRDRLERKLMVWERMSNFGMYYTRIFICNSMKLTWMYPPSVVMCNGGRSARAEVGQGSIPGVSKPSYRAR